MLIERFFPKIDRFFAHLSDFWEELILSTTDAASIRAVLGVTGTESPAFTGIPTAPTAAPGTNTAQIATTAFVATAGAGFAPLASPVFTGDPTAPTPATGDNDASIATTAFVKAQAYAPLASPALTGNPTSSTPAGGDNDTSIATTAFVQGELVAKAPLASPAFTGIVSFVSSPVLGNTGGTLASANDLSVTGNAARITGSTQINRLTSTNWANGSTVTLIFAAGASPLLKHNQAAGGAFRPMRLAGAVDFSATPHSSITFIRETNDDSWIEVSRNMDPAVSPLADKAPLASPTFTGTVSAPDVSISGVFHQGSQGSVAAANDITISRNSMRITGSTQINRLSQTGYINGDLVMLSFAAGASPVLKHNQASGGDFRPMRLAGAVDFSATPFSAIVFIRETNDDSWVEIARNMDPSVPPLSDKASVASVAGKADTASPTFTGTVTMTALLNQTSQGSVSSANNLTVNRNVARITGSTQINLLDSTGFGNGSEITLIFAAGAAPLLKHNQAASGAFRPMRLAGSVDFSATAHSAITFIRETVDDSWIEISRKVS